MPIRLQAATHQQRKAQDAREKRRTAGMLLTVFLGAIGVVAVLALVLGTIALVKYYKEPEAVFEVPPKEIKIPPKPPEHKMNVAKHEASKPKPTFSRKLVSTIPTTFALPDLPQVNLDQMLPLDPSELISDQVTSLMGSSGIGNGLGNGLLGGGGMGGGVGFMGMKAEGSRILLIFDVSASVVNKAEKIGIPFSTVRDETIKVVDGLPLDARFGLIQFVRNYKPFQKELVVATRANKDAAKNWVQTQWRDSGQMSSSGKGVISPSPNGIEAVLQFAFGMNPDLIFIISDGSFQRSPDDATVPHENIGKLIKELQEKSGAMGGTKINFIGFGMKSEDAASMKRVVRRNRGDLKELK